MCDVETTSRIPILWLLLPLRSQLNRATFLSLLHSWQMVIFKEVIRYIEKGVLSFEREGTSNLSDLCALGMLPWKFCQWRSL